MVFANQVNPLLKFNFPCCVPPAAIGSQNIINIPLTCFPACTKSKCQWLAALINLGRWRLSVNLRVQEGNPPSRFLVVFFFSQLLIMRLELIDIKCDPCSLKHLQHYRIHLACDFFKKNFSPATLKEVRRQVSPLVPAPQLNNCFLKAFLIFINMFTDCGITILITCLILIIYSQSRCSRVLFQRRPQLSHGMHCRAWIMEQAFYDNSPMIHICLSNSSNSEGCRWSER